MNNVTLTGRLGKDPVIKYFESGAVLAEFSLAVDKGKDENPMWNNVKCWKQSAEYVGNYGKKGAYAVIEGRLDLETWESQGQNRSKHVVIANRVEIPRVSSETQNNRPTASAYDF